MMPQAHTSVAGYQRARQASGARYLEGARSQRGRGQCDSMADGRDKLLTRCTGRVVFAKAHSP